MTQVMTTITEHEIRHTERRPMTTMLVVGGVLLLMISPGVWWIGQPDSLPIKQVYIEGKFLRLDIERLQTLASDEVRGGFFTINVAAIRDVLMALPWVKTASVHRVWPDSLRVVAHERVAVARWNDAGLLDTDGEYFAPALDSFPVGLSQLEGPRGSHDIVLKRFLLLTKTYGLPVASLRLNTRWAWAFELDSGLQVSLGRQDFENRVRYFVDAVWVQLAEHLPEIDKIDMRYTNGFTVSHRATASTAMQAY